MKLSKTFKFKITTKKLLSGNCQIKFVAEAEAEKRVYGYALVDAKESLKEVVDQLEYHIKSRNYMPYYLNDLIRKNENHPKSLLKNFIIFNS